MQPAPPQPNTNGMAIGSLVCSLLGFAGLAFIGPIIGIVLGISAKKEIARTGENGSGLAQAGIIIGIVQLVLGALLVIGFIILIIIGALAESASTGL